MTLSRVCEIFPAYFSDVWILVFGHFFGLELVSTTLEITGVSFYALFICALITSPLRAVVGESFNLYDSLD